VSEIELTNDVEVTTTVGSFLANFPELLGAMLRDPRYVVGVVGFSRWRYLQFSTYRGRIACEVVSNLYLRAASPPCVPWDEADEVLLEELGWTAPAEDGCPNWRFEADGDVGVAQLSRMVHCALREVFREAPSNAATFRSHRYRGGELPPAVAVA
jgi:hypothetical protein